MIPRILHRTLPAMPDPDVERIWATVVANTQGWDRRTYQSPRDPADWPLTGHLFRLCRDKAEESDLVRLEALWVHGGVYVDSDMELTRDLGWVLDHKCVIGKESAEWFGTAFMAAEPGHPAVYFAMQGFMAHVASQTERGTLPKFVTNIWQDRDDVTVLPQRALYPYHYTEKAGGGRTHDWTQEPDVYAVHHWHGSWVK